MRAELLALWVLGFIFGETIALGTQFWMVDRNWKSSRHLNLGTLILGLFSVPTALGVLILFARGP